MFPLACSRHVLLGLLATLPCALARAQDLIGLSFAGTAYELDSHTGQGQSIGATSRAGHNCMARLGRQLYTNEQVGSGASAQRFLNLVNGFTGVASRTVALTRDLRALAPGGSSQLLAIAENGASDELVSLSVLTGAIQVIGATGFSGLQGLTRANNRFYAWDLTRGLIEINFQTGVGFDVDTRVGTNGALIQFLTTMADGRVIGGNNSLYEIDLATGVPTLIGSGNYSDVRGAEERFGVFLHFGTACGPVALTLSGDPSPRGTVDISSTGHSPRGTVFTIIGVSNTNFLGLPLPLLLDPLLGTSNCFLYVSPDITFTGGATFRGDFDVSLTLPPLSEGVVLHLQQASLNPTQPGGIVFTNGASVRVSL